MADHEDKKDEGSLVAAPASLQQALKDFLTKNESTLRIVVPIAVCLFIGLLYFVGKRRRAAAATPTHSSFHSSRSRVRLM
jgi:hypothetical protein